MCIRDRIKDVVFSGNSAIKSAKLRRKMKKTKQKRWWNFLGSSKFLADEYKADKARVIETYNNQG